MIQAGSIAWFARHEGRLAWRSWWSLLTGGRRRRGRTVLLGFSGFVLLLHLLAYSSLARSTALLGDPDRHLFVVVTGILALYGSLMLSQAIEAVTRAFYGRGDLELILSSPAPARRLFAVRIAATAVTILLMSLALAAPVIDVMAWLAGPRWLAAYAVVAALAMTSVALAVVMTVWLFHAIGPKRTRLAAQIVAAVIGASFVIGVQLAAIASYGTLSRTAFLQSDTVMRHAPAIGSLLWWPARGAVGELLPLAAVVAVAGIALGLAIYAYAPRFGDFAIAAAGVSHGPTGRRRRPASFRSLSPAQTLRRKEWTLLLRDPWLVSQSLMQLLYLLPPVFLLYRELYHGGHISSLLVPVLVMSGGQLAGGLAWLAVSGEDAPELIASAPVTTARIARAKAEAVMGALAIVFAPFIAILAVADATSSLAAALGIAIAAASSTLIQFWFRAQAKRSHFRRRQSSSRIATIAEALSSITWAGAAALVAIGSELAIVPVVMAVLILAGTWMISPPAGAQAV
ncbi:MAG TPA: hypothetical protein VND87_02775 [Stellaceae bacterium]|nr:hypothetical protein [Stellaceae bacterium]